MLQTCAESIEELCRTRRTLDEQPMSMADMRNELETLHNDKEVSANDIERYSHEMDVLRAKVCLGSKLLTYFGGGFPKRMSNVWTRFYRS